MKLKRINKRQSINLSFSLSDGGSSSGGFGIFMPPSPNFHETLIARISGGGGCKPKKENSPEPKIIDTAFLKEPNVKCVFDKLRSISPSQTHA
ncbi:hypothetical protein [Porphyromonas pogonae]|uniref:hypothetical protein n=1 Tax=Porphyromonas pogonae TaxID=867595 RepID=UPI002E77FD15|nr:hypothetical protein [Porphyromonas pogonae]